MQVPKIVFLYKLAPGAAGASFGLNVALMAGLPQSVVARASVLAGSGSRVNQGGCAGSGDAADRALRTGVGRGTVASCLDAGQDLQSGELDQHEMLRDVLALPACPDPSVLAVLQAKVKQVLQQS